MKILYIAFVSVFLLSACSPALQNAPTIDIQPLLQAAVQSTVAAYPFPPPYPTYTYYPTYLPKATYTPRIVEIVKVVTATHPNYTQTSTYTPGPTNTLAPTETPTATTNPAFITATAQAEHDAILRRDHGSGVYLVGVDIAPGIWRSTPGYNDCYWERDTMTGDIIDNYLGASGITIYISPSDFQVQFIDCGNWTWLQGP